MNLKLETLVSKNHPFPILYSYTHFRFYLKLRSYFETKYSLVFVLTNSFFLVFLRCKLPLYPNDTYEIIDSNQQQQVNKYIPLSGGSVRGKYDSCYLKSYEDQATSDNFTLVKCTEWVFSKEYFESTIVSDVISLYFKN